MTDERIAELMGWPAFLKLEQCGPEDLVTRVKNLVATAEREEREKADARIADLERKLACARAEAIEDAINSLANWEVEPGYGAVEDLRALAPAPSGYVCVPVEPTQKMVEAGDTAFENGYVTEVYKAMLAAARGEKCE